MNYTIFNEIGYTAILDSYWVGVRTSYLSFLVLSPKDYIWASANLLNKNIAVEKLISAKKKLVNGKKFQISATAVRPYRKQRKLISAWMGYWGSVDLHLHGVPPIDRSRPAAVRWSCSCILLACWFKNQDFTTGPGIPL
jgi:hypothetical protein